MANRENVEPAVFAGFDDMAILPGKSSTYIILLKSCKKTGEFPFGCGAISDYYTISNAAHSMARDIVKMLRDMGYAARLDSEVNAKELVARSGLGVRGMNTLTYHKRFGSYFAVEIIATDVQLASLTREPPSSLCDGCDICAASCPTGALDGAGGFERTRCLRHWMDRPSETPRELFPKTGDRLLGCEECQRNCPMNGSIEVAEPDAELVRHSKISATLEGEKAAMDYLKARFGANYAGNRMRAQALILAKNADLLDEMLIKELRSDRSALVRALADRLSEME